MTSPPLSISGRRIGDCVNAVRKISKVERLHSPVAKAHSAVGSSYVIISYPRGSWRLSVVGTVAATGSRSDERRAYMRERTWPKGQHTRHSGFTSRPSP